MNENGLKLICDIVNQRELIQDDITCILDGLDDEIIDRVCQVVVDRMEIVLNLVKENQSQ